MGERDFTFWIFVKRGVKLCLTLSTKELTRMLKWTGLKMLLFCFQQLFHEVGENWVYDKPLVKRLANQSQ